VSEDEAKAWVDAKFGAASVDRLARFAKLLLLENGRQNLIAPSTVDQLWSRHLVDSAQLKRWGGAAGLWLDVGTGGGLPGLVLALLLNRPFLLVEPRRRRADFLARCVEAFALEGRVRIEQGRVETVDALATTISARAVMPLPALLSAAGHCAGDETIWVLPRGQGGRDALRTLPMWQASKFHVEHSATDPGAVILVGRGRP
jgi:16S rRNA (guanine527-N7)-methyltransferase